MLQLDINRLHSSERWLCGYRAGLLGFQADRDPAGKGERVGYSGWAKKASKRA